jgi:transcriptional regulator with XRE-family HTH domain
MLLTRLKYWRELRSYSLRELAGKSNIPYSAISLLENLKREPQGRTACKLAAALEVPITNLYDLVLPEQAQPAPAPINDNKTITAAIQPDSNRPSRRPAGNSYWIIENDPDQVEPFRLYNREEAERLRARLGPGRARVYEAQSKSQANEMHRAFLIRVNRGQDFW